MTYEEFIAAGAQADVLRILRICMDWNGQDTAAKLGISVSFNARGITKAYRLRTSRNPA